MSKKRYKPSKEINLASRKWLNPLRDHAGNVNGTGHIAWSIKTNGGLYTDIEFSIADCTRCISLDLSLFSPEDAAASVKKLNVLISETQRCRDAIAAATFVECAD